MQEWENGWNRVFDALGALTDADLGRTVTIRGEPHSVMQAINRQVAHYSHHVGQIVLLAKHFSGERVAIAQRAAEPVGRVQSEGGVRRCQPKVNDAG